MRGFERVIPASLLLFFFWTVNRALGVPFVLSGFVSSAAANSTQEEASFEGAFVVG